MARHPGGALRWTRRIADDAADVEHCYGHTGDHYVQALDFRQVTTSGGHTRTEVAGSLRFRIHVVET